MNWILGALDSGFTQFGTPGINGDNPVATGGQTVNQGVGAGTFQLVPGYNFSTHTYTPMPSTGGPWLWDGAEWINPGGRTQQEQKNEDQQNADDPFGLLRAFNVANVAIGDEVKKGLVGVALYFILAIGLFAVVWPGEGSKIVAVALKGGKKAAEAAGEGLAA